MNQTIAIGFLRMGRWDRLHVDARKGLAGGWEAYAWTWIQLVRAGLVPLDRGVLAVLQTRLSRDLETAPPSTCGLFCGAGGLAVVARLAASLDGSLEPLAKRAFSYWMDSCRRSGYTDMMSGKAGALLAAAEMAAAAPGCVAARQVKDLHRDCLERLVLLQKLAFEAPIYLGLAHGLAGYLLALENCAAVFGLRCPESLRSSCLEILARERVVTAAGVAWHRLSGERLNKKPAEAMNAWCHGAPGIGLALLCCYGLNGKKDFRSLAQQAFCFRPERQNSDIFCCGVAGSCQVLVEAYRMSGEKSWLATATRLRRCNPNMAPAWADRKGGFLRGDLGVRYLDLRLRYPCRLPLPGLGALSVIPDRVLRPDR